MLANDVVLTSGDVIRHICDNPPCVNPSHLVVGTHADNIKDMLSRNRQFVAKGETHPNAKLTAEQVLEIRANGLAGTTSRDVAKIYGVSHVVILGIISGKTWKSV